jgi:trk system potassium uptake protein TrkH
MAAPANTPARTSLVGPPERRSGAGRSPSALRSAAIPPPGRAPFRIVLHAVGWLLVLLAGAMLVPMAVDLAEGHPDWEGFAGAALTTVFVGIALLLATRGPLPPIDLRTGFLLTSLTWAAVAWFASLPFQLGSVDLSVTDAVFETVSGLTTTGATVIVGLDAAPRGLLLWRSLLQFVGGAGIVLIGLVMLPFLRIGGMQLFRTESSDKSDKLLPSTGALVARLLGVYLVLVAACTVALTTVGLDLFDAVNHAMTAVSTGGFSTKDASIGAFANPAAEWVLIPFMLLGALPFVRFLAILQGRGRLFWQDGQIRVFLGIVFAVASALAAWLVLAEGRALQEAFRAALFATVAVLTTTGYAAQDWQSWGTPVLGLFLAISVLGACTGSTAGGIKIFRVQILWTASLLYVQSLILPSRVIRPRYAGRPIDRELIGSVLSFVFFFIGSWGVFTVLLSALGLDLLTAISGAATALANVGPGLGAIIGPAGNFQPLSAPAKWLLVLAMLLGRLEFFTLLVLLHPAFWRR